jgi:hypothetical protein
MFGLISEMPRAVFQRESHPEMFSPAILNRRMSRTPSFRQDLASRISGTKSVWRISISFLKKEQMTSSFGSRVPVLVPTLSLISDDWGWFVRTFALFTTFQGIYQLVNTLRSRRIWPANVEHCPQSWTLGQTFLEKLLLIWLLSSMFCK